MSLAIGSKLTREEEVEVGSLREGLPNVDESEGESERLVVTLRLKVFREKQLRI